MMKDFDFVLRCLQSSTNIHQVLTTENLFNCFKLKYSNNLSNSIINTYECVFNFYKNQRLEEYERT